MTLPIPRPLLTTNQSRGKHWSEIRKAKADTELLTTIGCAKAKVPNISDPVTVRLIWYAPDARVRDTDSLYPTLKACIDALVKKGVLVDDGYRHVVETTCGPIVISRDNPRLELVIRRLEE